MSNDNNFFNVSKKFFSKLIVSSNNFYLGKGR